MVYQDYKSVLVLSEYGENIFIKGKKIALKTFVKRKEGSNLPQKPEVQSQNSSNARKQEKYTNDPTDNLNRSCKMTKMSKINSTAFEPNSQVTEKNKNNFCRSHQKFNYKNSKQSIKTKPSRMRLFSNTPSMSYTIQEIYPHIGANGEPHPPHHAKLANTCIYSKS
jgi:nitrate reductase alpha subunit